jgi:polyisoprenoid-binding protein YceI
MLVAVTPQFPFPSGGFTMASPNQTAADLARFTGAWTLDPARTSVVFHTKAMWVLRVKGTLTAAEGHGIVGEDGGVSGAVVLDAASLETGNKKRDQHLSTDDFFEVEKYPTITFVASGARPSGDGKVEVTGTLTIRDQTRPLTVVADVDAGDASATVAAELDLDRSEWGVSWAKMGAGVANHVVVSAHFVKA